MTTQLSNRILIKVSGEDAAAFLQNLLTNDIYANTPQYSMMLSAQGRFLFDIFTIKVGDDFFVDILKETEELLLKKLNMYKINRKVAIERLSHKSVYYSRDLPAQEIAYKDPRYSKLGYRFIANTSIASDNTYFEDKYNYAIPDGGVDMIYDSAMPQEYGAEQLNAISFTKGCYVGQETISRVKYQGQVRKKIYKVTAEQDLASISRGAEIIQREKKIGIFCSSYHQSGIALIREEDLGHGSVTINGTPVTLKIAEWYNQ